MYYYWYMILDVFSRKIVGHEVHMAESADLASLLMRRTSLAEGLAGRERWRIWVWRRHSAGRG